MKPAKLKILTVYSLFIFAFFNSINASSNEFSYFLSSSDDFFFPSEKKADDSYGFSTVGFYDSSYFGGASIWFPTSYSGTYLSDFIMANRTHRASVGINRKFIQKWRWGFAATGLFSEDNFYGAGLEPAFSSSWNLPLFQRKKPLKLFFSSALPIHFSHPNYNQYDWNENPLRLSFGFEYFISRQWYIQLNQTQLYSYKNSTFPWISRFQWGYIYKGFRFFQNTSYMSENYYSAGIGLEKEFKQFYLSGSYDYFSSEAAYHKIRLSAGWFFNDQTPPRIHIKKAPKSFSPDENLIKDEAAFRFSVDDMSEIKYWKLSIYDENRTPIRTIISRQKDPDRQSFFNALKLIFHKKSSLEVPEEITWNGDKDPQPIREILKQYNQLPPSSMRVNAAKENKYFFDIYIADEAGNYTSYNGSSFYLDRSLSLTSLEVSTSELNIIISQKKKLQHIFNEHTTIQIELLNLEKEVFFEKKDSFKKGEKFSAIQIPISKKMMVNSVYYKLKVENKSGVSWEKESFLNSKEYDSEKIYTKQKDGFLHIYIGEGWVKNNNIKKILLRSSPETEKNKNEYIWQYKPEDLKNKDGRFTISINNEKLKQRITSPHIYLCMYGTRSFENRIKVDFTPPNVSVKLSKKIFTPDFNGYDDEITFFNTIEDESKIRSYQLDIFRKKGPGEEKDIHLRSYKYNNQYPNKIKWDGITSSGYQITSYENLYARISVMDEWGNRKVIHSNDFHTELLIFRRKNNYTITIEKNLFLPATSRFDQSDTTNKILKDISRSLSLYKVKKLNIVVHSAEAGDEIENLRISEKRAFAVRQWFINNGFSEKNIQFTGKGEVDLRIPEESGYHRYLNERVVFYFN